VIARKPSKIILCAARRMVRVLKVMAFALVFMVVGGNAVAAELPRFLKLADASAFFQGADQFGEIDKNNPVAPVFKGKEQVGYIFINSDFVSSIGYSGKPIHMLVAIDMKGVLQKIELVEHHEPIVLIGIPEKKITALFDDYIGRDIPALARGEAKEHQVDAVSGATVTVMVMDDTVLRSAIKVARLYGLGGLKAEQKETGPQASLDLSVERKEDWVNLLTEGSVRRLKLTVDQVSQGFEKAGNFVAASRPESEIGQDTFIELYAALVSVPSVGKSLLGEAEYKNMQKRLESGQQAILLAGDGLYSFKGSGYVRGGIFDRFQVLQGDSAVRFHDYHHKRLRSVKADGAPALKDVDLFIIPDDIPFNPAKPWIVELLIGRATGPTKKGFLTLNLENQTAEDYLKYEQSEVAEVKPDAAAIEEVIATPVWKKMWQAKTIEIVFLVIALTILSVIFFFQQWLVKRPKLTEQVRIGYLIFILVGVGWYANAQLSVVNILAALNALVTGFDWSYFLMEPLIFILWGSVAVALLFWGRGPYCGWLCPFGALQELLNKVAKRFKVPQWVVPWGLHERLWPLKYMIFLGLFGVSLHSLSMAEQLSEVEPFKTVIILNFIREWPFVIFGLLMLAGGLFVERFYCRYLCPLGAALAIPGKLRMFEWLKRYKECGKPCQICANECMVQAIHPEGNINVNECLYCLHCHVLYSDHHKCPVMIKKHAKQTRFSKPESKQGQIAGIEVVEEKVSEKN